MRERYNVKVEVVDMDTGDVVKSWNMGYHKFPRAERLGDYYFSHQVSCSRCDELIYPEINAFQCEVCDDWFCEDHLVKTDKYEMCPFCAEDQQIITKVSVLSDWFKEIFIDTEDKNAPWWPDYPARRQTWNDWVDSLYKDGQIAESLLDEGLPEEYDG